MTEPPVSATRQLALASLLFVLQAASPARAQSSFEDPPIDYYTAPVTDVVSRLQQQIDSGDVQLEYDAERGYLAAVLRALDISPTSQTLVFSKTSFQRERISPARPRALYFNDHAYIGWVQGGPVMEVSTADPRQGAIFYTLAQRPAEKPQFVRDRGDCISCHASARTRDVPGHVVRSVYPAPDGQPHFGAGTFTTTDSSPFSERWGGWYVTGTHGQQRHMGNVFAADEQHPERLDRERGANVTDLAGLLDTAPYLTGHSDIVALMVLEHQTDVHNAIARAGFDTRRALRDGQIMNQMLGESPEHISDSTRRRIDTAAQRLLESLLLLDEAELSDRVQGTSRFAEHFASLGARDSQGRSLRDLDLQRRLFRYPCSYLVDSQPFQALPEPLKHSLYQRLWDVLTGDDTSGKLARLSPTDRQAILEILRQTHPGLPPYWKTS